MYGNLIEISLYLLVIYIPLPLELAVGLTIHYFDKSFDISIAKYEASCGNI